MCVLGAWGACSLSLAPIGSQTGNMITPLTPEGEQLHWGRPMAGIPHVRPVNLEQLPSPRQQLGPAGHKSLMTRAEHSRRLLQEVGDGVWRSRQAGAQKIPPSPPNSIPSIQAKGGAFASLLGKLFLTNHSSFHTTTEETWTYKGRLHG